MGYILKLRLFTTNKTAKLAPNLGLGFGHESNPRLDTDVRWQIDGLIPPRNCDGSWRYWQSMVRSKHILKDHNGPETWEFPEQFFFADIFDRIRQNLGFHLMLEIFHDSFLKMIIIWQLYDVMDIKKNLQIGKLWWCSIHWSWEVTYLPACILLHPFQPWRCFDFQSEWQQNTHIEKRCERSKQEIQVSFSLDFRCQDGSIKR